MSSRPLRIQLLGPLEVLEGDVRLELPPSKKTRALLAYLATTGRQHSRSSLCDLFWQDVSDPRAGLRWALSKLRGVVDTGGSCRIVTSRDRAGLATDDVDVDLDRVRAAVGEDPSEASVDALKEAGRAFRGEFLEGLDLPGCHQYQAWCLGMRERLRSLHVSIHATLTTRLRSEPGVALPHALARLTLDPFAEDAYIAAMDVLGDLGRVDRARETYERCRRMLSEHLGVRPSGELEAARRRLEGLSPGASPEDGGSNRDTGGDDGVGAALARLPAPDNLPAIGSDEPSLVGRTAEMEALRGIVGEGGADTPDGVTFVCGEPGIGKTRLLRELVQEVRSRGAWALSGPVFESEEVRPYGPWADMLSGLPASVVDAESREGLAAFLAPLPSTPRPGRPAERAQLFDAVAHLLRRMAQERPPGLVVLDDVQWLDTSSAALLHYLVRTLGSAPLAFVLAGREEEIGRGSTVARVLRSLDAAGRLRRIAPRRLDASETEALVRAMDTELDPAPVFATSEGNPFFALAVAASLREGVDRMPATIEGELADRLDRLDPAALSLLPWAAALGRAFDVPTLVRMLDRPLHEIVDAIDSLEHRGILRATGRDRYDFTHSLLRQAAYRRVSEPARRTIHRSIARELDAAARSEGRAWGAVAHHAQLGGLPRLSARACVKAAEDSLWIFAFDEAAELVRRGLAQAEALADEERISLEMDLLRVYSFRNMEGRRPDDVEARVERVTEEARNRGMTGVIAAGHALLMDLQYQRGAFEEAGRTSVRYAEASRESGPVTAIRALAETASCLLLLDQAPDDARRLAAEAFKLAGEHEVEMDVVALARALLAHHDGELGRASRAFGDVIRLGRRARDRWWECPAMMRMIMVDLDRGDPERALARSREAEELAERLDDSAEAAFARGLAAVAERMLGSGTDPERSRPGGEGPVDAALRKLRELDSLWKIGHVQAYAAEVEVESGDPTAARERARETLEAARTLGRPSLLAVARGLLARCALAQGDTDAAVHHLDSPEITRPDHGLSHRAREVIRRTRDAAP